MNQLTVVTVDRIIKTTEAKVTTIYVIHDETIDLDKVCYSGVCMMVLIGRRIRNTWIHIWMRRRWRMRDSTMKDIFTRR